jgi:hypothetical protein
MHFVQIQWLMLLIVVCLNVHVLISLASIYMHTSSRVLKNRTHIYITQVFTS